MMDFKMTDLPDPIAMKELFNIPIAADVNYYFLFYLISFSVAFLVIALKSLKFRTELASLSIINAGIFLAFVFGCKLMPFLENLLSQGSSGEIDMNQMALGGVMLSFLLVAISMRIVKLPGEFYYAVGLALLVGLCVQKPGCFFAGCCRGFSIENGFSVTYGNGVARLPLPLIEMLMYAGAVMLLLKVRVKDLGSKYFLAVILFCTVQFTAEFLKDPTDTLVFASKIAGIKGIQWIYLILASGSAVGFAINERGHNKFQLILRKAPFWINLTLLFLISTVFLVVHPLLFRLEIFAINMALIPAIALVAFQLFNYITIPNYRWVAASLLILPVFLMSQTIPSDTTYQKVYKTISVGAQGGNFANHVVNDTDPGSCDGTSYSRDFKQKYTVISAAYSNTKVREKEKITFRINSSVGSITEENMDNAQSESYTIFNFSPYYQIDYTWFGFGIGGSIGANQYAIQDALKEGIGFPESGLGHSPVLPIGHLRVGPNRFFALEYNFNNHEPFGMPVYTSEFSIDSGFGARNDFYVRYGVVFGSINYMENASFLSAYIPINNTIVLEPTIGFNALRQVYMMNFSYRFGHMEIPFIRKSY